MDIFINEDIALNNSFVDHPKERHYLGRMDVICKFCNALHWECERLTNSSKKNPLFGSCCLQGKIKLSLMLPPPPSLLSLYEGSSPLARSFREHIRSYNAANAFTSIY
ncbi:non-specific serine/threonine protein kinase [Ranunculus cassubicifolius]